MKLNMKALALMGALAAGVASAAETTVGTGITNTATATFTDPSNPNDTDPNNPKGSTPSNTVTTTVLPKPAFDIVYVNATTTTNAPSYNDGTDFSNLPSEITTGKENYIKTIAPNTQVVYTYAIVNNGNTPIDVTIGTNVQGSGLVASDVKYYIDKNNDGQLDSGDTVINAGDKVNVAINGNTRILQVYTPTAAQGVTVGATPVGTGTFTDGSTVVAGSSAGTNAIYVATGTNVGTDGKEINSDLQWNNTIIGNVATAIGPKGFPEATAQNGASGSYTDPNTSGATTTTITESGDSQTATPTPLTSGTAGSVQFTNTIKNTGETNDNLTVTSNKPGTIYYTPTGTGTEVTTAGVTVSITPANGTDPAYNVTYKLDGSGNLVVVGLHPGDSATFQDKIPYISTGTTGLTQDTTLTVTSANDTSKKDDTHNIIKTPGLSWGDQSDTGTAAVPNPDANPNPSGTPGQTVTWPMEVVNTGPNSDTFYPSTPGPVFKDANGNLVPSTVTYYPDADCDGVKDSTTAVTSTNPITVASGGHACFIAEVKIPDGAITGTTPAFDQTVTSGSGQTLTDTNDTVTVALNNGGVLVGKYVNDGDGTAPAAPAALTPDSGFNYGKNGVKPGDTVKYEIIAKNAYNGDVSNFKLTDPLDSHVTYAANSAYCTLTDANGAVVTNTATTGCTVTDSTAPTITAVPVGGILKAGYILKLYINAKVN